MTEDVPEPPTAGGIRPWLLGFCGLASRADAILSHTSGRRPLRPPPHPRRVRHPHTTGSGSVLRYTVRMDPATILTALKALTDLRKLTKELGQRVPSEVRDQLATLCDKVSDLQGAALATQQREFELTER